MLPAVPQADTSPSSVSLDGEFVLACLELVDELVRMYPLDVLLGNDVPELLMQIAGHPNSGVARRALAALASLTKRATPFIYDDSIRRVLIVMESSSERNCFPAFVATMQRLFAAFSATGNDESFAAFLAAVELAVAAGRVVMEYAAAVSGYDIPASFGALVQVMCELFRVPCFDVFVLVQEFFGGLARLVLGSEHRLSKYFPQETVLAIYAEMCNKWRERETVRSHADIDVITNDREFVDVLVRLAPDLLFERSVHDVFQILRTVSLHSAGTSTVRNSAEVAFFEATLAALRSRSAISPEHAKLLLEFTDLLCAYDPALRDISAFVEIALSLVPAAEKFVQQKLPDVFLFVC